MKTLVMWGCLFYGLEGAGHYLHGWDMSQGEVLGQTVWLSAIVYKSQIYHNDKKAKKQRIEF